MIAWIVKIRGWMTKLADFMIAGRAAGAWDKENGPKVDGNKDIKPR